MKKRARNHKLLVGYRKAKQELKRILPSDVMNNDYKYKRERQEYEPQGKQEATKMVKWCPSKATELE